MDFFLFLSSDWVHIAFDLAKNYIALNVDVRIFSSAEEARNWVSSPDPHLSAF